jgi:hypothetical protein
MNYDPLHPYNMSAQELEEELSSIDAPGLQAKIDYILAGARRHVLTEQEYHAIGVAEERLARAEALDQELIRRECDSPFSWTDIAHD